jgi:hypothetical protein
VAAFDPDPARVLVQRSRSGGWQVREAGHGLVVSGAFTVELHAAPDLDAAIAVVEDELARRRRLIPTAAWTRRPPPRWHRPSRPRPGPGVPWTLTVFCDEGTWRLRRVLDERFRAEQEGLGDTGMDLDRAIRTADRLLHLAGWSLLGDWARDGETATTRAHRPTPAGAGPIPVPTPQNLDRGCGRRGGSVIGSPRRKATRMVERRDPEHLAEAVLPLDGPYDPQQLAEAAEVIAALGRRLAHATLAHNTAASLPTSAAVDGG